MAFIQWNAASPNLPASYHCWAVAQPDTKRGDYLVQSTASPVESTQERAQTNARLSECPCSVGIRRSLRDNHPDCCWRWLRCITDRRCRPLVNSLHILPSRLPTWSIHACDDDLVLVCLSRLTAHEQCAPGDPSLRDSGRYATPHSRGLSFRWQTCRSTCHHGGARASAGDVGTTTEPSSTVTVTAWFLWQRFL